MVWSVFSTRTPGGAYFFSSSTALRKKSSPMSVGSPPCQAMVTSGTWCASMVWRIYASSTSSDIRKVLPG